MSKPTKEQKLKSAYDFWKENPHTQVGDLVIKFKTNKKDLGTYLKDNSLPRPDGRIIGKESPRQQAIKASYEAAHKAGETPGWAERYARDKFGMRIQKGDIRYYAMKNSLPDLREVESFLQQSPHKKQL
jgi:hypothetical protein